MARAEDKQSDTKELHTSEPTPQAHSGASSLPTNQARAHVFKTASHNLQAAPTKHKPSNQQRMVPQLTTTDTLKGKKNKSVLLPPGDDTQSAKTMSPELLDKVNPLEVSMSNQFIAADMAGVEAPTVNLNTARNPSSTPFLPAPTLARRSKSESKRFATLSGKSSSSSPAPLEIASMTEGSSKVQINEQGPGGHSQNPATASPRPEKQSRTATNGSSQEPTNLQDGPTNEAATPAAQISKTTESSPPTAIVDQPNGSGRSETIAQAPLKKVAKKFSATKPPPVTSHTEHQNATSRTLAEFDDQGPSPTNKATDKPTKKLQGRAETPGSSGDRNRASPGRKATNNSKLHPSKDKPHTTRYFGSDTKDSSADPKGKTKRSAKDTSRDTQDKDTMWFIDVPSVDEQRGVVNIASFNLPSLRQEQAKSAADSRAKVEYQEVVVTVPVRSDFVNSRQDDAKQSGMPSPSHDNLSTIEGKTAAKKKKKRNKKKKPTGKDSTAIDRNAVNLGETNDRKGVAP